MCLESPRSASNEHILSLWFENPYFENKYNYWAICFPQFTRSCFIKTKYAMHLMHCVFIKNSSVVVTYFIRIWLIGMNWSVMTTICEQNFTFCIITIAATDRVKLRNKYSQHLSGCWPLSGLPLLRRGYLQKRCSQC